MCVYLCVHAYVCVGVKLMCKIVLVCVCIGVVFDFLAQLSSTPTLAIFHLFPFPYASQLVHPAVIRDLAFAGVQIQRLLSQNSNGPGGTSGAHTVLAVRKGLSPVSS